MTTYIGSGGLGLYLDNNTVSIKLNDAPTLEVNNTSPIISCNSNPISNVTDPALA